MLCEKKGQYIMLKWRLCVSPAAQKEKVIPRKHKWLALFLLATQSIQTGKYYLSESQRWAAVNQQKMYIFKKIHQNEMICWSITVTTH